MQRLYALLILIFLTTATGAQNLNDEVLKVAKSYEGGGYKWAGSGTPKDLSFKNARILTKSTEGTYCSGYTFMVAFEVLNQNKLLDAQSVTTVKQLQQNWYGSNEEAAETQCLMAVELLGLGNEIKPESAMAGDFVQFWRNNKSGHSVIFLGWMKDETGEITGINYRSTQKLTNGIGNRTETIGDGEKDINWKRLYVVRLKG